MLESMLLGHAPVATSNKYDAFVAWAAAYTLILPTYTTGSTPYGSTAANSPRSRMVVPATWTPGVSWGSSWGALWGFYGNQMLGAIIHAFPDSTTTNENAASGRTVVFTHRYTNGAGNQGAFTRNGYSTVARTGAGNFAMDEFIYYDKVQDKVMRLSPFSHTDPAEFVVPTS
jgi:hypothetical protein